MNEHDLAYLAPGAAAARSSPPPFVAAAGTGANDDTIPVLYVGHELNQWPLTDRVLTGTDGGHWPPVESQIADPTGTGQTMDNQKHLRTWTKYQSAWGPVDDNERMALPKESVDGGIVYADLGSLVHGLDELVLRIGKSQAQVPGATFRNDRFAEHHDQGFFEWTMSDRLGDVFVTDTSFGRSGGDGRLVEATGFFQPPARG